MKNPIFFTLLYAALATAPVLAEEHVRITTQPLGGCAHMLTGQGGNIGVCAGEEGILIIDDQFERLAEEIAGALKGIANKRVKYVINTHLHGDHTGGNAWFKRIEDATVMAHRHVRKRMSAKADISAESLPVVTFNDGIEVHFNGELLRVMHLPKGHTDGDAVVWFTRANVLHTGDLLFNRMFPFIDLDSGGTVAGYMANIERLLGQIDQHTKIIPGHGKLASKQDVEAVLQMLKTTAASVARDKAAGHSEADIIAKGVTPQYKDWAWSFISEQRWLKTLYRGQ